jgi:hypothetical protein
VPFPFDAGLSIALWNVGRSETRTRGGGKYYATHDLKEKTYEAGVFETPDGLESAVIDDMLKHAGKQRLSTSGVAVLCTVKWLTTTLEAA